MHHLRRHHQGGFIQGGLDFHRDQLTGPQRLRTIGKLGLGPQRARGGADLVVDQAQLAFSEQAAALFMVTEVGVDRRRLGRGEQLLQGRQLALRQGELDGNRVHLGDAEQALGIADAQEVALVDIANPHATGHRRADLRIGQLHLCRRDRSLIALHRGFQLVIQRLLLVDSLLGHAVIGAQQAVAFQVHLGHMQLRLALPQLRLGLFQAGANGAVIDHRHQLAGLYPLTFLDQQLGQHPVDLRAYHHAMQRQHIANATDKTRHILLRHLHHMHRHTQRAGGFRRAGGRPETHGNHGDDRHRHHRNHEFAASTHASDAKTKRGRE